MDWLSIAGSVASIGGAVWAWREAKRSSRSASKAEQIKTQLVNQRMTAELSEIKPLLSSALDAVKHYNTRSVSTLAGLGDQSTSKEAEAEKVQSLLNKVVEFSDYFPEGLGQQFYDDTDASLQEFLSSTQASDTKKFGCDLHRQLLNFSTVLRKNLTEKKEATT